MIHPNCRSTYQQLARIDAATRVDVLLIGDSTLGNTIDVRAWRDQSGKDVLALPLTGGYGYAGALNMLRRVLRRHHPELVIEIQSLDMATRSLSWEGLLFTAERPSDVSGIPPWRLVEALARVDLLQSALGHIIASSASATRLDGHDYWPQRPRDQKLQYLRTTRAPNVASIHPDKFEYLRQIGALCHAERITCLYAHGPFLDPQCSRAAAYLHTVNAQIEENGLQVVPGTPRCMSIDQVGDAADHVRPGLRASYSEIYRTLIASALAADGNTHYLAGLLSQPSPVPPS